MREQIVPLIDILLVLIIIFMLIYYRLSGVNAVIALVFNLIILLGLMAYIGAVMTLPGIAGFVAERLREFDKEQG